MCVVGWPGYLWYETIFDIGGNLFLLGGETIAIVINTFYTALKKHHYCLVQFYKHVTFVKP